MIEGVGGVFEDQVGLKLRYWVPTTHPVEEAEQRAATRPGV